MGGVKAWRNTDLFTVETKKYVDTLNSLNKFNNKVKYLPNGFFSDLVNIDLSRIKKEKIILTVGRLGTYQKNTELLIEALISIEDSLDDWKIYLVGPMTDEFKIWLNKKLINHQFLKEKIVVTGNITDKAELYKIYAKASIFVLPSRYESWGLVLTEAIHFSAYSIVTKCCDAFEEIMIENNKLFGTILKREENFACILKIVINDIENYKKIAKQAAKSVDSRFNWDVVAKKLEKYLKVDEL